MQKTTHGDGGSSFIRGLTGNQTLILVDGVRLNNYTFRYGPDQYFNTIDPFSVCGVEAAKGTESVQYSSDASRHPTTNSLIAPGPDVRSGYFLRDHLNLRIEVFLMIVIVVVPMISGNGSELTEAFSFIH